MRERISPLCRITVHDVNHLDTLPLAPEEMHGRRGPRPDRRRPSTKILSDMKFLMKHIVSKLRERGLYEEIKTIESVDRMYQGVADLYNVRNNPRNGQISWMTTANQIRDELKQIRNAQNGNVE